MLSQFLVQFAGKAVVSTALVLLLLVTALPFMDTRQPIAHGPGKVLGLFARDTTVRRTTAASAIGLICSGAFLIHTAKKPNED